MATVRRAKTKAKPDVNDLPNTFKFAAEVLKTMSERGGSAGSIVVNKYKSYNYKLIFALVMNTVKNIKIIKKIVHEAKLMNKVPENNPFILEVLLGDLLFGKGLKSVEQNSTASRVLSNKDTILKQYELLKSDYPDVDQDSLIPKYLRINKFRSNKEHVISQLKSNGFKEVTYSKEKIKFKKFINKFKAMNDDEFIVDFHFPTDIILIKAKAVEKLKKTDLLKKCHVILQDKASFMAVEALDVEPDQIVVDACCAPGCKTSLIASKLKNKGKILGFDVNKKRLLAAKHLLKLHGANCVKLEAQDFSKIKLNRLVKTNVTGTKRSMFDSILIDPSCSGSGIKSRVDYKKSNEIGRLKKLQAFQVSLLKHALKACASRMIVYCTCSTSTLENEQVVEMALNESGVKDKWKVVDVLPYWAKRGDPSFEFGEKCIRSDEDALTNGFFIAKLEQVSGSPNEAQSES